MAFKQEQQSPTLWIGYISLMTGVLMAFMFVVVCVALVIGANAHKQSLAEIANKLEQTGEISIGEKLSLSLKDGLLLIYGLSSVTQKDEIIELAGTIELFLEEFENRVEFIVYLPEKSEFTGQSLRDAYFKHTLLLEQFELPIVPFQVEQNNRYNKNLDYVLAVRIIPGPAAEPSEDATN